MEHVSGMGYRTFLITVGRYARHGTSESTRHDSESTYKALHFQNISPEKYATIVDLITYNYTILIHSNYAEYLEIQLILHYTQNMLC